MKITISEKQVLDAIASVLMENRKVLKLNSAPSTPPAPSPDMGMPMQDPMGGMGAGQTAPSGYPGDPGVPDDPSMEDPNAMGGDMGGDNQFDTNFDAGVEADEETDPKHYIQQLTGKLSQSLNSFNNEQGPDAGLSKYVASMIISAACKNLDEKAKKELIEKINTASSDDENVDGGDEMPDEEGMGDEMGGDMPMDDGQQQPQQQQPMMEHIITKKELHELALGLNGSDERQDNMKPTAQKGKRSIFCGKPF